MCAQLEEERTKTGPEKYENYYVLFAIPLLLDYTAVELVVNKLAQSVDARELLC